MSTKTGIARAISRTGVTALLCMLVSGYAMAAVFEPAFGPNAIDFNQTRQYAEGEAIEADRERVYRTLGFDTAVPALQRHTNREQHLWRLGEASGQSESEYGALLVLGQPVAVGTVALSTATIDGRTGETSPPAGQVWYWDPDATGTPDPDHAAHWIPVPFEASPSIVQFGILPPGTRTRAFLYRESRVSGEARIRLWRFYSRRLHNVTPHARASGELGVRGADPRNLSRGGTWRSGYMTFLPSQEQPVPVVLTWPEPVDVRGLVFCSDAMEFDVLRFTGPADVNPALAGSVSWEPVPFHSVHAHGHGPPWHVYRWLDLGAAGPVRALRLNIAKAAGNGADEYNTWVSGLSALIDLGDGPVPAPPDGEADGPPVHVSGTYPLRGEASIVVNDAAGRRVRHVEAQKAVEPGPFTQGWDLKDERGHYVEPGRYAIEVLTGAPLRLHYQMTPYPNVNQRNPNRTPWLREHTGPHGWLSDHAANQSLAVVGERIFFSAWFCEAGVALIECNLDGDKQWGQRWGSIKLTSDGRRVFFIQHNNRLVSMDPETRETTDLAPLLLPERSGTLRAVAGGPDGIFLAYGGMPLIENAVRARDVDLEAVYPRRGPQIPGGGDPRSYFLRSIRVTGTPPGQHAPYPTTRPPSELQVYLDSTFGPQRDQYIVIPFHSPVPLGSLVVPYPDKDEPAVEFATLDADADWPPNPGRHQDWTPVPHEPRFGRWTAITMPADTRTRALRIRFTQPDAPPPDDLFGETDAERFARSDREPPPEVSDKLDSVLLPGSSIDDLGTLFTDKHPGWLGRLEGIKLLKGRFRDVAPEARIRVNSGTVDANGVWDAERSRPIWDDDPGIYMMEWDTPRELAGLAIKEIDGEMTMIDVWQGDGAVTLEGEAADTDSDAPGWRTVNTYNQPRRNAYQPAASMNVHAVYMDGYVDFEQPIRTRAVRLRVMRQWLHNMGDGARRHDGRHEHGIHYSQSHTAMLDTRICRVEGVAALEPLETVQTTMKHRRLEMRCPDTGDLLREWPVNVGWNAMDVGSDGAVYAYDPDRSSVIRVDPGTGAQTVVIENAPGGLLAVGPGDEICLLPWRHNRHAVLVHDRDGRFLRGFGTPRTDTHDGPWDPERPHRTPMEMRVDGRGQLWIVEGQINLRRIVSFDINTGRLLREILGNTQYGGAGWLHRYRQDRAYHLGTEFRLDWDTRTSGIDRTLDLPGTYAAVRIEDRTYLASLPPGHFPQQNAARIYLEQADGPPRLVAAFGNAEAFGELRQSAILNGMGGDVPANYLFIWSDLNGDGKVDPDEVQLERKSEALLARAFGRLGLGRIDNRLGCAAEGRHYRVERFLPDGVPVYVAEPTGYTGHLRLDNGNILALHGWARGYDGLANQALSPAGDVLWRYPVHSPGVHGLGVEGWEPGRINNEFGIIGHETASGGDLGEFVVVHANTGQWNIWTADGHLAGQIFQHKSRPEARFLSAFDRAEPDMRLDPIAMPQEAFHGNFVKYEDGRYIALAGFTEMNLVEVKGLDDYVRLRLPVEVTAEDLRRTREWEATRIRQDVESRALVVETRRLRDPIRIDGFAMDFEWPQPRARLVPHAIYFRAAYDDQYLYLCWQDEGRFGRLRNSGDDWRRLFKTGAALDFMLGTDPAADPERASPVRGDVRILIAFVNDQPRVVLYEPVAPAADRDEAWSVETPAGGRTAFDRVATLRNATAARNTRFVETQWSEFNQTTVEVRIPLADIGLTIDPEAVYPMDWGVLLSDDGIAVKERLYWANRGSVAAHTADEPTEARLEPRLWGRMRFEPYDVFDALLDRIPNRDWPSRDL